MKIFLSLNPIRKNKCILFALINGLIGAGIGIYITSRADDPSYAILIFSNFTMHALVAWFLCEKMIRKGHVASGSFLSGILSIFASEYILLVFNDPLKMLLAIPYVLMFTVIAFFMLGWLTTSLIMITAWFLFEKGKDNPVQQRKMEK